MNLKHDLLRQPLELKKTHDFVAVKEPRLAVVLIHGIASDSSTFTNALKYLEGTRSLRDIRFVTFDLLGSGKSYRSDSLGCVKSFVYLMCRRRLLEPWRLEG